MKKSTSSCLAVSFLVSAVAFGAAPPTAPAVKKLKLDSIEFFAPANVSAFNISGVARTLEGEATISATRIEKLTARVAIDSLTTKMSLRDTHMKKKVFQTKDGKTPDLVLSATGIQCVDASAGLKKCPVKGEFEIQGLKKPFEMDVMVKEAPGGYSAEGQGVLKLSDYGIPQPEQLGVKVANEVTIKVKVIAQ